MTYNNETPLLIKLLAGCIIYPYKAVAAVTKFAASVAICTLCVGINVLGYIHQESPEVLSGIANIALFFLDNNSSSYSR